MRHGINANSDRLVHQTDKGSSVSGQQEGIAVVWKDQSSCHGRLARLRLKVLIRLCLSNRVIM